MTTLFSRLLPTMTKTSFVRKGALGIAGLAFAGGAIAGPALATHPTPALADARPVAAVQDRGPGHGDGGQGDQRSDRGDRGGDQRSDRGDRGGDQRSDRGDRGDRRDGRAAAERSVRIEYQAQPNFYYCGPASTRIALSAQGHLLSQDEVAKKLGTTEAGTNSAIDITRVLNEVTGKHYKTTEIPGPAAKPEHVKRLAADVVRAVDEGRVVVANVKGTAVDTDGNPKSYEGGHYLTVVGYRDGGNTVKIADPFDPGQEYWMTTDKVANWIAERGYSS